MKREFNENGIIMEEDKGKFPRRIRKWWERRNGISKIIISVILIIVILLFAMTPLYLVDYLYGTGFLSYIPHNFQASDWFSTAFSFIPSTILGILSLYLTYYALQKDRDMERIQNQYRFIICDSAVLHKISKGCSDELSNKVIEEVISTADIGFINKVTEHNYVYVFEFYLKDTANVVLQNLQISHFEWQIRDKTVIEWDQNLDMVDTVYIMDRNFRNTKNKNSRDRIYEGKICFLIEPELEAEAEKEIACCMGYTISLDNRYRDSYIYIKARLTDQEKHRQELKLWFQMEADEKEQIKSTNEMYYLS